ncbi:hypothetical protein GLU60_02580 [Nanohaloarchaea archaeon H01]|nr:hypothetical protein [Nanohaloarchaea archaeon H01]
MVSEIELGFEEGMKYLLSGRSESKKALGGSGRDGQNVNAPNITEDVLPSMVSVQEAYSIMEENAESYEEFKEKVQESDDYTILGKTKYNEWIGFEGDFE